jgi:hypothetical protein
MRAELKEVMKRIGEPGASQRAAKVILEFFRSAPVSTDSAA